MNIVENYNNIKYATLLDSGIEWPTMMAFGAIHWNEHSWTEAINEFISNVKSWDINIISGRVILVSVWNELARDNNVRFVEENMNRIFLDTNTSDTQESIRARELMSLFEEADYLLDLHSTSGESIPFAFCEENVLDLAQNIWIPYVITGWSNLGGDVAGDTENYMNNKWGAGITFESGNHLSPQWKTNSCRALNNFLASYGVIDKSFYEDFEWERKTIRMSELYNLTTDSFEYALDKVENFMIVKAWDVIWYDWLLEVKYDRDICLVMPTMKNFKRGEEIFFVWEII